MPRPAPKPDIDALVLTLPAALQPLARQGVLQHYRRGALLIEEGDRGDALFILLAGRLRAFSADLRGREITYGLYGPGEYLGEMSLDGGPRSASVEAVEPSLCAMVTRQTLLAHIAREPAFAFELMAKVIRRARAATLSARQLALEDAYGRLKALLDDAAAAQPDGTRLVGEPMTHREIAARLGCSREMVSRLLKDLAAGGYVTERDGRLQLNAPLPSRW
ncbi:MAG: Crp/Fnr family transcriptional regulator [Proteobacteria bacterium]|nr:Crp/Fnr family transcriptional regulator [Pseudomonadota bacterium]